MANIDSPLPNTDTMQVWPGLYSIWKSLSLKATLKVFTALSPVVSCVMLVISATCGM